MKNKLFKIFFAIAIVVTTFLGITSVNAYNSNLIASKSTVNSGDSFTISLNLTGLSNKLGAASYKITFDDTLFEYDGSSIKNTSVSGNVVNLQYYDETGGDNALDNGTFAVLSFKVKSSVTSDATGNFTITKASAYDKDSNSIISSNTGTSVKVHVLSDNNYLSDLKIDSSTIKDFDKDKTSYEITLDKDKVEINAILSDNNSKVVGTGIKTLNYGSNTFNIVVTSEKGTSKTYKLIINRTDNRSDDATLKNISIDGISFSFKSDKTTYNLTIDKETVNISAIKNNDKASISGDIGSKKLSYGNNSLKIVVTSEKGTKNTYTLNITRKDARSANNNLASLKLSEGTIDFKASTTTYDVTVNSNITKITVDATLADSKASFVSGYGPRTINLVDGNNKVLIKIKNEKEEIKTYTININKDDGRETNADLEYLKIEEGTIEFDKDLLEYKITVENDVNNLTINTKTVSSKAKIEITNPTLLVGENKVKILVTAENGATKEYLITVIKTDANAILSDNNYLDNILVEGYNLIFEKDVLSYNLKINDEETLIINAYPSNENSSVTILGNEDLKDGSVITIRVISENGETRDYKINIQTNNSSSNFLSNIPTNYLVVGILLIVLIILIILIVIKKNKEKSINNSSMENSYNNINPIYTNNEFNNQTANTQSNTNNLNINNQNIVNDNKTFEEPIIDKKNIISDNNNDNDNIKGENNNKNNSDINKPINNASGLTKVCPSCGRRVPYEVGTCPYCLNDF